MPSGHQGIDNNGIARIVATERERLKAERCGDHRSSGHAEHDLDRWDLDAIVRDGGDGERLGARAQQHPAPGA